LSKIVSSEVVRIYKGVHTWTGVIAGLALFIAFYAGAITVFEGPLSRWTAEGEPPRSIPIDRAERLIERVLAERPDAQAEFRLHLTGPERDRVYLAWQEGRKAASQWTAILDAEGTPIVAERPTKGAADLVDHVHRTAALPGGLEFGTTVMGLVSALYVIALVSGLIVWLPSAGKDLLALRLGRGVKRKWLDAHNLVGVASLPFHLAIALTAVVFGLHDSIYAGLDRIVYQGQMRPLMQASNPFAVAKPDARPAAMLPPSELIERVRTLEPGLRPLKLQYRRAGTRGASLVVWGEDRRHLVRLMGFTVMSPVSGEILDTQYLPGHQGLWSRIVSVFFALHFGTFGGEPVRWGYFVLGLAGAFLFYSGNLLWIESRRRSLARARDESGAHIAQRHDTRIMAALTVGVGLGCIGGLSLAIALGKLLHGQVTHPGPWLWLGYYALFLGSVIWALRQGAARAAAPLLLVSAMATLCIPLASLLIAQVPLSQLLVRSGDAVVAVDAVALCAALGLLWMAWLAHRRARKGATDSVWSLSEPSPLQPNSTAIHQHRESIHGQ